MREEKGKCLLLASLLLTLYLPVTTQVTIRGPGDTAWLLLMTAQWSAIQRLSIVSSSAVKTKWNRFKRSMPIKASLWKLSVIWVFTGFCNLILAALAWAWLAVGDSNRKWIPDNGDTWLAQAEWGVTAKPCHAIKSTSLDSWDFCQQSL